MRSTGPCLALLAAAFAVSGGPYDADPDHPWNRVHRALFARLSASGEPYDADLGPPPLWRASDYLFEDERYLEATRALDAFLADGAAQRVDDPLRRALLQHDLWTVAEHCAGEGSEPPDARGAELARRAVRAAAALALSRAEIDALPDNYAAAVASERFPAAPDLAAERAPFLPPRLFDEDGPWVLVRRRAAGRDEPFAPAHTLASAGRSVFATYVRVPGERAATLAFLDALAAADPTVPCDESACAARAGEAHRHLRGELPRPPVGTAFALVERLVLFDDAGRLAPTPLVRSVQLRVLRAFEPHGETWLGAAWERTHVPVQFDLSRSALLAGRAGGLVACGPDEVRPSHFGTHGDPLTTTWPRRATLASCTGCHGAPGMLSVASYTGVVSGPGTLEDVALAGPVRGLAPATHDELRRVATRVQSERFEWGFVRALLAAHGR